MTEEGTKINHSTIVNYMNAPFMVSFGGTKENIVKFIIGWYHNGKFYFDKPVEISAETIYKLTGLSSKGDPIPVGIEEGMIEILTRIPTRKKSKGLIVGQIKATTPKMVAKIVSMGRTVTGRGCDLKLDMLEVVNCIAESGKVYYWDQYLDNMLKSICEKFQKIGAIIRFPSLLIWISIYHLCPVGDPQFLESTRFHMWCFKSFSMGGTP